MLKIENQHEDEEVIGKTYRLYPRGTRRTRSNDIRIVYQCKCYEPIMNVNGTIVSLEHHCKYYSDPI